MKAESENITCRNWRWPRWLGHAMTISKSRESCMKSMTGYSENWPPKDWNGSRSCRSLSIFNISSRIQLFVGFCVHGGVILPLFVPVVCSSVAAGSYSNVWCFVCHARKKAIAPVDCWTMSWCPPDDPRRVRLSRLRQLGRLILNSSHVGFEMLFTESHNITSGQSCKDDVIYNVWISGYQVILRDVSDVPLQGTKSLHHLLWSIDLSGGRRRFKGPAGGWQDITGFVSKCRV